MNAGGLAGVLSWLSVLPLEAIKIRQQMNFKRTPIRLVEAYKQLKAEGGIARLYKGAAPTLLRGYFQSAISLPLFLAT